MTRTLGTSTRGWLAGLLLITTITTVGWAQEQTSVRYQNLADEVITKLEEFNNATIPSERAEAEKSLGRLCFRLKQYEILAHKELKRTFESLKRTEHTISIATDNLKKLDDEAKVTHDMRIESEETIELLLRNCLVEINRLELEKVTARKLVEKESKPSEKFDADRLRLEAEEISLKRMKEKLEATKKLLERNEGGKELQEALRDQETEIAVRATKLEAIAADYRDKLANAKTSSEDQVKDIEVRHLQLISQIKDLVKQQKWAKKAKQLNADIESDIKRLREEQDSYHKAEAKLSDLETYLLMIEKVTRPEKKE